MPDDSARPARTPSRVITAHNCTITKTVLRLIAPSACPEYSVRDLVCMGAWQARRSLRMQHNVCTGKSECQEFCTWHAAQHGCHCLLPGAPKSE